MRNESRVSGALISLAVLASLAGPARSTVRGDDRTTLHGRAPKPAPTLATVTIQRVYGAAGTQNVGEHVSFLANVTGGTPLTYAWTVSGQILKDYQESTTAQWSTTSMTTGDFQAATITFYWLPEQSQKYPQNGGPVTRHLHVDVTTNMGPCSADLDVSVERNTSDIDRQPVDFYAAGHCPTADCPRGSRGRPVVENESWQLLHSYHNASYDGGLLFDAYHQFGDRYSWWRGTFG